MRIPIADVSDCTQPFLWHLNRFRFQTHQVEGDKPFTQAFENWDRDAWEKWQSYVQFNSVSGHLHLSHKNLGLTDPSF